MNAPNDLKALLAAGIIDDELTFEQALIFDRKLRLMVKEKPELMADRIKLRSLISAYEQVHWSKTSPISFEQIKKSDAAEKAAEAERRFIENRKQLIKAKLKLHSLTQEGLGQLLGHGKSYTSELMNGLSPFTLRDLVLIHKLFDLPLESLVPVMISRNDQLKINQVLKRLKKPGLKRALEES